MKVNLPTTTKVPKQYSWEEIQMREGVYKTQSSSARFVTLKCAAIEKYATLYYKENSLQPASGWETHSFSEIENVTVNFSINE